MIKETRLIGLSDRKTEVAQQLSKSLKTHPPVLSIAALIQRSDLVIECAHVSVVPDLLKRAIRRRKDLLIISTGGLVGQERHLEKAKKRGCHITIPSGAVFGIDGLKAAALFPFKRVTLTTRKPPQSFEGVPFVVRKKIQLSRIKRPTVLFRGSLKKAIQNFPQNINVASTLAFSGIHPRRLKIQIIADPSKKRNSHEVVLEGPLGTLKSFCENVPSQENAKTSRLAIVSVLAALKALFDPVRVGT